jgi:hypothetical protein
VSPIFSGVSGFNCPESIGGLPREREREKKREKGKESEGVLDIPYKKEIKKHSIQMSHQF